MWLTEWGVGAVAVLVPDPQPPRVEWTFKIANLCVFAMPVVTSRPTKIVL